MNQLQNKSFEEALVRYREKWDKIKDPCVVYDFPIPDVSCKELFLKRVSEHPDKTYVISHGAKMSYVECNTLAAKIANGFLAKGLKKGDRVITYVSNGFEFVALAHACFKTGIIMVNTNPRSTADEIIRRIKDCTPKMVITDSDGADAVVQALKDDKAGVEHMVFCPALVYGDNVFEKDGIRRDRTGDGEKTRCLCGKRGIFNRDGPAMGPQIIRQLERRASRRSASFFHALASPGRPRNGGGASGAYQPAEGRKALI